MTNQSLNTGTAKLIEQIQEPFLVSHYRWPNGLNLLHQPDHGAPLLSFQTWVNVGSADEVKHKTGIAHFFEHLMFKATKNHAEGEFDRILESVGGEVNAATWLDWTYYYADLPSEHLEKVLALEADRLVNLDLNEEVLEAERQVVMNERRECVEDDPDECLSESLWYHLMGSDHPYGHSTIGWMEDIERLSLEDCREFYQSYYAPNQVTLVISGDVTSSKLLPLIEQYYAGLPSQITKPRVFSQSMRAFNVSTESRLPNRSEQALKPKQINLDLDIHMPRVHIGFRVPSVLEEDSIILECLDELLFEGDSSRVYKALIYDLELASYVYSLLPQFRGEAVYEIGIDLKPEQSTDAVQQVLINELQTIAEHGVDEGELTRVKRAKELHNYRSLQTVQQRAQSLGFWQNVAGDFKHNFARLEKINRIKSEDIQSMAQKLLDPHIRCIVIGQPLQ